MALADNYISKNGVNSGNLHIYDRFSKKCKNS